MEIISVFSGQRRIECSAPVYYARRDNRVPSKHVSSHLVAWPSSADGFDEICYIRLKHECVPVLVTSQPDGSVWLGGAYLDTIAREFGLIAHPLSGEMEEKAKEWLRLNGNRLEIHSADSLCGEQ